MRQVLQLAFASAVSIPAAGDQVVAVPAPDVVIPVGAKLKVYAASGLLQSVNPNTLTGNGLAVVANWEADPASTLFLAQFALAVCPTSGTVGSSGLRARSPLGGVLMEIDNTISVDAEPVLFGGLGGVPQAVEFELVGDLHNPTAAAQGWIAYFSVLYDLEFTAAPK